MADELYESGHLVKLYWEPTPGAALEEITDITSGDLGYGGKSNSTEVTSRGQKVDSHFTSPVIRRDIRSFQRTANPGSAQDVALQVAFIDKQPRGWKMQGVDPAGGASDAYIFESGALLNYDVINPHGDGPVRADLAYRPTGAFIINGTTVS